MDRLDDGVPPRGARRLRRTAAACLLSCLLAAACSSLPRQQAPLVVQQADAVPVGFASDVRWRGEATRSDFRHQALLLQEPMAKAANGSPLDLLALSGGGAGGAFGAGVLVGWGRSGTRPQFQVVTGVSTGALIAPLAFLGADGDRRLTEAFSGAASDGILQSHWAGALFGASVFRGEPLRQMVDRFVTADLLQAVAAEAAKGRLLLVGTTDLDRNSLVIWDMGAIAAHGGPEARKLFRDVLVASASVPGVFPPVLIRVEAAGKTYEEMHVDGGTTASLVAAPDIGAVISHEFPQLRGAHMYILINGKLGVPEETASMTTVSILQRSVGAALKSITRGNVEVAYAFARRHEMTAQATAVPVDYPFGGSLDFAPATMKALFDYGAQCAAENRIWADALDVLDAAVAPDGASHDAVRSCPVHGDLTVQATR
jgi:hypothetical protein